ncbi:membrane protein [Mycobacterium phage MarkPhew]|uniref:Membrane protein n=1 Tax=Mycobacterium phage MarkPhew TaxID=2725625 RepID=A0A6M3SZF9_9CAUD|nr:membrane protein [Mycobacterium phage MarkPhew]QJD50382.1 membrane protein [Mycobacterium phage MarkPhew]
MSASPDPRAAATRYFRAWLAAGTGASVLGNVTHALLDASAGSPVIAAAVAVVPPVVLLGATHGVHALVQSRIVGGAYRAALSITVAVACAAFVLSFAALRELAIVWAGIAPAFAWLVPVVVDLSITGSTIALLALSGAERAQVLDATLDEVHAAAQPVHTAAQPADLQEPLPAELPAEVHRVVQNRDGLAETVPENVHDPRPSLSVAELIAREADASAEVAASYAVHAADAERIVAEGVTRIDRVKVAEVLAEHAQGVAPSMIARKLSVGYSTVVRILDHHTAQAAQVPA